MKVYKYIINDVEYMRRKYKDVEGIENILEIMKPFSCCYTLISDGNGTFPDRYELTDLDGNRIPLDSLNGYEKGVILNGCMKHFAFNREDDVYGVLEIREEN